MLMRIIIIIIFRITDPSFNESPQTIWWVASTASCQTGAPRRLLRCRAAPRGLRTAAIALLSICLLCWSTFFFFRIRSTFFIQHCLLDSQYNFVLDFSRSYCSWFRLLLPNRILCVSSGGWYLSQLCRHFHSLALEIRTVHDVRAPKAVWGRGSSPLV